MMKFKSKKSGGFLLGALAGGIVGSVTALLLAPKAGSELRAELGERAARAADRAGELSEKIGSGAAHAARQTAEGAAALKDKALHTADHLASNIKFWERKAEGELAVISAAGAEAAHEAKDSFEELTDNLPLDELADEAREEAESFIREQTLDDKI